MHMQGMDKTDDQRCQPQNQAERRRVEHGLHRQAVQEERRRPERQQKAKKQEQCRLCSSDNVQNSFHSCYPTR